MPFGEQVLFAIPDALWLCLEQPGNNVNFNALKSKKYLNLNTMKKLLCLLFVLPVLSYAQRITTFAGNGTKGIAVSGTAAAATQIGEIHGVAMDYNGNVYIASTLTDNRILKVNPVGIISVFAGNGTAGYSGDGGGLQLMLSLTIQRR